MILPDVNVLIYAFRSDASHHSISKTWLDAVIDGDARFGVSPLALSGLVRITTNRRVYQEPSSIEDALGFCEDLLGQPHCQIIEPSDRHWMIFHHLCIDANSSGPHVTDAWFAALAIEHGCTWITYDRDFARFPGLDWRLLEA